MSNNTDNPKTVDASTENLDDFNDLFEGRATEAPVETEESQDEGSEDETLDDDGVENSEESELSENDEEADDNDNSADENSSATDEDPAPKKKKQTAQERINELTAARREAERRAERAEAALEERRKSMQETKEDETKPDNESSKEQSEEPKEPDHTNKEKYPLGEFDPAFIRDLTEFQIEQRVSALDKQREEALRREREAEQQTALQQEWQGKLSKAEENYEDFREKVETLEDVFSGVDPQFGQFIAETVMAMENGPDVLYYLAENPNEATLLSNSGSAVNAALALGKIEAQFAGDTQEKKAAPKQSKAPKPPKSVNKGNSPRFSVKPDTDDLDAFENVFFETK